MNFLASLPQRQQQFKPTLRELWRPFSREMDQARYWKSSEQRQSQAKSATGRRSAARNDNLQFAVGRIRLNRIDPASMGLNYPRDDRHA